MAQQINSPMVSMLIAAATAQFKIMMSAADGSQVVAVGSVPGNANKITGTLQDTTFNDNEWKTVMLRGPGAVRRGLLKAGEAVVDLTVPLTLTDAGELEVGGAGIEIGMPVELKTAPAGNAVYIGFRWLN